MKKNLPILSAAALLALSSQEVFAQAPVLYNTISGIVWSDNNNTQNGIREAGEEPIGGILVSLHSAANDSVLSTALSDATGTFTINNYTGIGTYYLSYAFPSAGYEPSQMREGTDEQLSSAADPLTVGFVDDNLVTTPSFIIASNANLTNYGLGLQRLANTVTYWAVRPQGPTIWNETFTLPRANSALGTLQSARIFVTDAVYHPSIGIENTGAGITLGEVEANGRITFTPPTGAAFPVNTLVRKVETLAAYDNSTDYIGTSGLTWNESYSGAFFSPNAVTNATVLANNYLGGTPTIGTISVGAAATSLSTIVGSGNVVSNVTTESGAGVFVTYTYSAPISLATQLLSFDAKAEGSAAQLSWAHAAIETTTGFAVERSTNGRDFSEIGFVSSEAGRKNQSGNLAYSFTDATPAQGRNFYRLKQTDASGRALLSAVRSLSFGSAAAQASYPNPADAVVMVSADAGSHVMLYDAVGRLAASATADATGHTRISTAMLPAGVYSVRTEQGGNLQTERLVIQHR